MKTSDDFFSGKHVLITGDIGFIGSALARRLVAMGAHVVLVDSLIPEYGGNLYNIRDIRDKLDINISDVRDPHSMRYLVREADLLFNLAGQTSHLDSMQDPFTDLAINSSAQLYILEACRHYNPSIKIVFASTRQIYGRPTYLTVDEQHPLQPTDVNGINKLAGEQYHILYHRIYGIRSCALRMTNTYGPGMRIKDARQTFVGIWIRCILENEPFEVWGGDQLRDFNYVDDAVDAFMRADDDRADGRIFNLGGHEVVSLIDLAGRLVQVAGRGKYRVREFPEKRQKIDIGDYYADFHSIREKLGWTPRTGLTEGLSKTIAYFKEHLEHYT